MELSGVGAGFGDIAGPVGGLGGSGGGVEAARGNFEDCLVLFQCVGGVAAFEEQIGEHFAHGQQGAGSDGVLIDGVFVVGGLAQEAHAFVVLVFGEGDEGGGGCPIAR